MSALFTEDTNGVSVLSTLAVKTGEVDLPIVQPDVLEAVSKDEDVVRILILRTLTTQDEEDSSEDADTVVASRTEDVVVQLDVAAIIPVGNSSTTIRKRSNLLIVMVGRNQISIITNLVEVVGIPEATRSVSSPLQIIPLAMHLNGELTVELYS